MNREFKKFLDGLKAFLDKQGIEVRYSNPDEDEMVEALLYENGEEFTIGNFADSGASIKWLGAVDVKGNGVYLVIVNGVIFEAQPRHVAGWIVGYQ